jgi:hypothetical protein
VRRQGQLSQPVAVTVPDRMNHVWPLLVAVTVPIAAWISKKWLVVCIIEIAPFLLELSELSRHTHLLRQPRQKAV